MFDLAGTQYERGVFELRLERPVPKLFAWIFYLGPVRSRILFLVFLLILVLFSLRGWPVTWLIENGILEKGAGAQKLQALLMNFLMVLALLFWGCIFFFQKPQARLIFDKLRQELRWEKRPLFRFSNFDQGLAAFKDLQGFEAWDCHSEPKTPHGFIRFSLKGKNENLFEIRLLSDEQFKFFPLNLSKILQKNPTGNWKDPEEEA